MKHKLLSITVLITALLIPACTSGLGQDAKSSQGFTEAQNSTITQQSTSTQDAYQVQGASVTGEVQEVNTNNSTGMTEYWFIIGALVFGLIMPQPTFIRALFV